MSRNSRKYSVSSERAMREVRCKSEFSLGKTHFCNRHLSRLFRMTRNNFLNSLTRNISWNCEPAIPPLLTKWYYFLGNIKVPTHLRNIDDTEYFMGFLDTEYFLEPKRRVHNPASVTSPSPPHEMLIFLRKKGQVPRHGNPWELSYWLGE